MSPTPADYRAERIRRGLTQKQLAALLGVSRVTIAKRETGATGWPITREAWRALIGLPLSGDDDLYRKIELLTAERDAARVERNHYQRELRIRDRSLQRVVHIRTHV